MSAARPPSASELEALEEKYAFMVAAHEAHRARTPIPPHATFRAMGQRFPGALKELERLPPETLRARLDDVRRARAHGDVAPWIAIVHDYHHVLARCLALIATREIARPTDARETLLDVAIREAFEVRPRRPKLETITVAIVAARAGLEVAAVVERLGFVSGGMRSPVGSGAD